jgi:FlhB-like protein
MKIGKSSWGKRAAAGLAAGLIIALFSTLALAGSVTLKGNWNPEVKARIRSMQMSAARQRMMQEVPKADVVITNPTHIAVALRYDQESSEAPEVVAKGAGLVAEKIKKIAREHGIPVVENKALARILFKIVEINQMIPENLYQAVAEVLAYIYRRDSAAAAPGV